MTSELIVKYGTSRQTSLMWEKCANEGGTLSNPKPWNMDGNPKNLSRIGSRHIGRLTKDDPSSTEKYI